MKVHLITCVLSLISIIGYAQSTEKSIDNNHDFKNAIVFTAGTSVIDEPFIPSFQYERTLLYGKKKKRFLFGINTGYTRYKSYKENLYHMRLYMLNGRYSVKFELAIGALYSGRYQKYSDSNGKEYTVYESYINGASNIGLRYQKEGSRFLIRLGVGSPEVLYMGVGFRF